MIIEKLVAYAQNARDADGYPILADPAFPAREPVHFLITLNSDGACLGIGKTGSEVPQGRKKVWEANEYRIPAIGDRASEKQARLLCDVTSYVFGPGPWSVKRKSDGTVTDDSDKHAANAATFQKVLKEADSETPNEESLLAVQAFYKKYAADLEQLLKQYKLWLAINPRTKKEGPVLRGGERFAFALSCDNGQPAFERPDLKDYWRKRYTERLVRNTSGKNAAPCLSCGAVKPPVSNQERTIRLPWGQPKGVKLISFEGAAFRSHGLKQSLNAPMCQECVDAYTLALNHLLEKGRSSNYIDNDAQIAYAFWSREPVEFDLNATFLEASEDAVKSLYESPHRPSQSDGLSSEEANDFYVLALSASGARAIVRDWIETHLPGVQRNLKKWFEDLAIIADRPWPSKKEPRVATGDIFRRFPIRFLSQSVGRKTQRGWEVQTDLSSRLFRTGLTSGVVTDSVLASALRRIRADHDIPPPRAALIKLVLNRLSRSRNQGENAMPEKINTEKPDPAYVCGRLLAVLDRIQGRALGSVNASIIDRYYGAASTAPRPIFPRLVANAQNHLGKLKGERPGEATNLQKDMEQVIGKIGDPEAWIGDLPQWLDLEAQGRFAIGFYHQRADYRARTKKSPPVGPGPQQDSEDSNPQAMKGASHAS